MKFSISQIKIALVVAAVIIAAASLVVSHILVRDLAIEERNRMEVWAEAMRSLSTAEENTDLNLVLKVINENNTIPVIVTDDQGNVQTFRNVEIDASNYEDSMAVAAQMAEKMRASGRDIKISLGSDAGSIHVSYDESVMITRLSFYPYVQLGIVLIFVVIAIFALLTSKKAEQNKVWVGLSKETAHQLGTPISSLNGWLELLRTRYPEDDLLPDVATDINRLQLVAERFSRIGSAPTLQPTDLRQVVEQTYAYMRTRISNKVEMELKIDLPVESGETIVQADAPLMAWVVENLIKNAVDAMNGRGWIGLHLLREGETVILDVTDTGKGIERKRYNQVFRPGYTTKSRGWGLGLSLCKRIVEEYHRGKIFVHQSVVGKGTTFRVVLRCAEGR